MPQCRADEPRRMVACTYKDLDFVYEILAGMDRKFFIKSFIMSYKTCNCIEVYPIGLD